MSPLLGRRAAPDPLPLPVVGDVCVPVCELMPCLQIMHSLSHARLGRHAFYAISNRWGHTEIPAATETLYVPIIQLLTSTMVELCDSMKEKKIIVHIVLSTVCVPAAMAVDNSSVEAALPSLPLSPLFQPIVDVLSGDNDDSFKSFALPPGTCVAFPHFSRFLSLSR